jgi:hypothetical protein
MKQNKDIAKEKENNASVYYEEEEIEEYSNVEDDPEVWFDFLSEEIVTAYHVLQEFIASQGLPLLDNCQFPDFVDFCYRFSSGRKPAV